MEYMCRWSCNQSLEISASMRGAFYEKNKQIK